MNIAFGTVILFLIIVPGIILRRFYYTEEFSKKYTRNSVVDEMVFAIIPALIIHFSAILILHSVSSVRISFDSVAILLSGNNNADEIKQAFCMVRDNLFAILIYNFVIWNVSAVLGIVFRVYVRRNKLDRKFHFLKHENDWHYLLNGEILDFPKNGGNSDEIDLIFLDALVKVDGRTLVYTGILVDYKMATGGGLDFILLKDVKKRYLPPNGNEAVETFNIPGDYFVLFYSQVINLNLTYYKLEEEKAV